MDQRRFEAIVRILAAPRTRRGALWLLVATSMGFVPAPSRNTSAADVQAEACRPGTRRCRRNLQCCSGRCNRRRGERRGRCTPIGPFAANCAPLTTCMFSVEIPCRVGNRRGFCTVTASGDPFCAAVTACDTDGPPICAVDADCVGFTDPPGRCFPCPNAGCDGDVLCAVYAGDV